MVVNSIRLQNFRTIQDSGVIRLGPINALVGDNGSGKTSLIDAMLYYCEAGPARAGANFTLELDPTTALMPKSCLFHVNKMNHETISKWTYSALSKMPDYGDREVYDSLVDSMRSLYGIEIKEVKDGPFADWSAGLSSGQCRLLLLLLLMRRQVPFAPILVIEDLEEGLDPRAIHFIVNELRQFTEDGDRQVIFTTHSPYLLNLLDLSHVIFVQRNEAGLTIFSRPDDNPNVRAWAEDFAPGDLWTTGRFTAK